MGRMIAALLMLSTLVGVPDLTGAQRDRLAEVVDDERLEGPGMHVLIENTRHWEPDDEAGARVPDYEAILTEPGAWRGELCLIEGRFAGRERQLSLTGAEPGDEDELTEWVVLVSDQPDDVVVVYFPDSEDSIKAPAVGAEVRTVGRFYKVWKDRDANGDRASYLTFIAGRPSVIGGQTGPTTSPLTPMLILVVILGGVYVLLRIQTRRVTPAKPSHAHPTHTDDHSQDPAEALQHLADEHEPSD